MENTRRSDGYWLRIEDLLAELKTVVQPSDKANEFGAKVVETLKKHPVRKKDQHDQEHLDD